MDVTNITHHSRLIQRTLFPFPFPLVLTRTYPLARSLFSLSQSPSLDSTSLALAVARHVSRIKDVQRSVADYSHSPYLGCCVCRGVLSN